MKLTVYLGDELNNAEIKLPKTVPVTKNFNTGVPIGTAEVRKERGEIIAELKLTDEIENISKTVRPAGTITERKGNLITKFDLKLVSIQCQDQEKSQ